jgi:hypothetical protein
MIEEGIEPAGISRIKPFKDFAPIISRRHSARF